MDIEFLQMVAGGDGDHAILGYTPDSAGIRHMKPRWGSYANAAFVSRTVEDFLDLDADVYFSLGSFSKKRRTAENCTTLKSFWADIDAGAAKYAKHGDDVYPDLQAAKAGLGAAIQAGLPAPTYIVESGEGLHVYWALETPVTASEWKPVAQAFFGTCRRLGLKVDPSRARDVASILRVPGTIHTATGKEVGVVFQGAAMSFADFRAAVGAAPQNSLYSAAPANTDGLAGSAIAAPEYAPKSFGKIIRIQEINQSGCQQLTWMYQNQAATDYQAWLLALSIAKACEDGLEWAHKISSEHPEYSAEAVETKLASLTNGPARCETFEMYRPGGCAGCPHKANNLSSPVLLGRNPESLPTVVYQQADDEHKTQIPIVVPELPWPYFTKPSESGVFVREKVVTKGEDGQPKEEFVEEKLLPHTFYIHERTTTNGDMAYLGRVHLPHDGIKEFSLPAMMVVNPAVEAAKTFFANKNILLSNEGYMQLGRYLRAQANALINTRAAQEAPAQWGWQGDGSFVWGDVQYTRAGAKPCPVADDRLSMELARATKPRGTVTQWADTLYKMYSGDDAGTHRMQLALALGAPIGALCSSDPGGIVHAYSSATGQGKTFAYTAAYRALLTFDNAALPGLVMTHGTNGSTPMAMIHAMGTLNSVPLVWDEISNVRDDYLAEVTYAATGGRGKLRMSASSTRLRDDSLHWASVMLTTANKSLLQAIAGRGQSEAQMARVFEFPVKIPAALDATKVGIQTLEALKRELNASGATLAPLYFDYLVKHQDTVRALWAETFSKVSEVLGCSTQERFVVNMAVQAIVFAKLAEQFGWWKFPATSIVNEIVAQFNRMRGTRQDLQITTADYLAEFFNDNHTNAYIYNPKTAHLTSASAVRAHNGITHRIEIDTGVIYIVSSKLRQYCRERQIDMQLVLALLERMGANVTTQKRMLDGTELEGSTPRVRCYRIDSTHPAARAYFDMEELAAIPPQ